jgi:hypothetical protein
MKKKAIELEGKFTLQEMSMIVKEKYGYGSTPFIKNIMNEFGWIRVRGISFLSSFLLTFSFFCL